MPRLIAETKQFDYKSEAEFEKHRRKMGESGWICREHYPLSDDRWHYSAHYERGVLVNGINGNGKYQK